MQERTALKNWKWQSLFFIAVFDYIYASTSFMFALVFDHNNLFYAVLLCQGKVEENTNYMVLLQEVKSRLYLLMIHLHSTLKIYNGPCIYIVQASIILRAHPFTVTVVVKNVLKYDIVTVM